MLQPYRRHSADCPGRKHGQNYTLCHCPIWVYGHLNGEPFRRSLGTRDWDRALVRLDILQRGGEVLPDTSGAPLLSTAVDAFLGDGRTRGLTESTLHSYSVTLAFLGAFLGSVRVSRLDVGGLMAFRRSRTLAASTQARETVILRIFCAWCIRRGWLAENPARSLSMPLVPELVTQPYTTDEVQRLLAACEVIASSDPQQTTFIRRRARALVLVLLYSGLRISDVATLRRASLEPSGHLVLRRIQKTGVPIKVLLHKDAVSALRALPATNPTYFFWSGRGANPTTVLRKTIYRLGAIAKVGAAPHRFRDTFAVELLTAGADIRTVQKLLGHSSVRVTERNYAHFVAAHQRLLDEATAKLDFGPKPGRPVLVKRRM